MKKLLLMTLGFAAAMTTNAFTEPAEYINYSWQGIAPNGSVAVSEIYGAMTIVDFTTGSEYSYEDPDYVLYFTGGLGNFVSNNGIVVGNYSQSGPASYWKAGEWYDLDGRNTIGGNIANAITPDGSRICGGLMMEKMSTDAENIMLLPCIWDATADGYGEYTILPHPSVDFVGRTPQYVSAIAISADGKTIVGQITDYSGFVHQPIVYTEGADGEWSYSLPAESLFHPEGYDVPEDPGECPDRPQAQDFMTEEEYAAYQAAIDAYWNNGGQYPIVADFMTEDELAAYNDALAAYNTVYEDWSAKYDAFSSAFQALCDVVPNYEFNNVYITPNGQKYITSGYVSVEDPDSWWPISVYYPTIIDLTTGEVTNIENNGVSMMVADVPNDNDMFLCNGINDMISCGWLYRDGVATPVEDWLSGYGEEMAEWIQNTLKRNIVTGYKYDNDGNLIVDGDGNPVAETIEAICTGVCVANSDLSTVAMWCQDTWSGENYTASYIFNLDDDGSTDIISVGKNTISFDEDGNIVTDGDIKSVEVYDLQGRQILTSSANGTIANNLPAGIYVIRAHTSNCASFAAKIRK